MAERFRHGDQAPTRGARATFLRRGVPIALGGLVITGAGTAWALAGESGPTYRTAVASVGSVDQLANFTGTVAKSGRASAAFGVRGTVDKVRVAVGDRVQAGDVLATLDKSELQAAVRAAQATLAEARATLASDSSGSSGSSAGGSGSTGGNAPSGGSGSRPASSAGSGNQGGSHGSSGSSGTGGFQINLATQVAGVNDARTAADTALDASKAAMTAQAAACDTVLSATASDGGSGAGASDDSGTDADSGSDSGSGSGSDSGSDSGSGSGDSTSSNPDSASGDGSGSGSGSSPSAPTATDLLTCADALKAVQDAQAKVAAAQDALDRAGDALTAAMNEAVKQLVAEAQAAAKQAQQITQQATQQAATIEKQAQSELQNATQAQSGSVRSGGGTSGIESTARIAVDRATVTAAESALAGAKEDLNSAVLKAPVGGEVGEVPFAAGDSVAPSDAISLLGTGAVQVTIDVPLTTATTLRNGMPADVTGDGATEPAHGTVTSIGVLPSSTSGTSTYPVTILVPDPPSALAEGASAAVAISLKSVTDVVTVPNSALTPTGTDSGAFVTLLTDGKPVRRTVTTGAIGQTRTEVTDGVTAGETVVLADTSAAVPASSTTSTRTGFGGATFGGGTFPAGGAFAGGRDRRG